MRPLTLHIQVVHTAELVINNYGLLVFSVQTQRQVKSIGKLYMFLHKHAPRQETLWSCVKILDLVSVGRDEGLSAHLVGHILDVLGRPTNVYAAIEAILLEYTFATISWLDLGLDDELGLVVILPGYLAGMKQGLFARERYVSQRYGHPIHLEQLEGLVFVEAEVSSGAEDQGGELERLFGLHKSQASFLLKIIPKTWCNLHQYNLYLLDILLNK